MRDGGSRRFLLFFRAGKMQSSQVNDEISIDTGKSRLLLRSEK